MQKRARSQRQGTPIRLEARHPLSVVGPTGRGRARCEMANLMAHASASAVTTACRTRRDKLSTWSRAVEEEAERDASEGFFGRVCREKSVRAPACRV